MAAFILARDVRGPDDLLLGKIDHRVLSFAHFEVFRELVDLLGHRVKQLAIRVHRAAAKTELLGCRIQHEVVDHFACRDIDHFNAVVIDRRDIDLLVIRRQANRHRSSGFQCDAVDDLALGLIEHQHRGRVGRNVQGARAGYAGKQCQQQK
jgi:hypothetical protein